ncbi:MAG: ATP-dependent RNA helicase RhlB [Gammaproteobacteria bacterium]|nr:ATP-dependent RNA helicase RhlB [Gammaproteobacteria bacterium]
MTDHLSNKNFDSFGLNDALMQGIRDAGFTRCTPIQALALPVALKGQDVAGQAQTGTGKTAAFLVAMYEYLHRHPAAEERKPNQPRALIVAPTRELAVQIAKDADLLGPHTGLKTGLVYGGEDYDKQRQTLVDGVDVLIGTPGRLIDYFKQKVYDLSQCQVAVMDEADRMFDMGFIKDIRFLLRRLPDPDKRLTMLFSATLSHRVMELAYEHMNNPETVLVESESITVERIRQLVFMPANHEKIPLLIGLLRRMDPKRTMVFINTKRTAETLNAWLNENGIRAEMLSGDVRQNKRLRLLREFQSGELPVLVTTDVASRGLHIPEVSHVFNFDLPQDAPDYVHRIGRTARAGAEGDAISFACEDYAFHLPEIEEYIGHPLPRDNQHEDLLADDLVKPTKIERAKRPGGPRSGGRPGGRSSGGRRQGGGRR